MVNKSSEYSAGIMSECSWFLELKKIVTLRYEGSNDDEIKRQCLESNLFGIPNEYRNKRIYGYLNRRLHAMDDALVRLFCTADLATQKLINLITILKGDRLFFEFVNEVYREKCILGYDSIEISDANVFFTNKTTDAPELSGWKETTFPKVRNCYLNFMTDANLLKKDKRKYLITVPIVDEQLERYLLDNGDERILKAITGVR